MCNLSDGIERHGIEIGKELGKEIGEERTTLKSLQSLMKNMQLSLEQAMAVLEVPETDCKKYADMLKA